MFFSSIWNQMFSLNVGTYIWSMFPSLFCGATYMQLENGRRDLTLNGIWMFLVGLVFLLEWMVTMGLLWHFLQIFFLRKSACIEFTLTCKWEHLRLIEKQFTQKWKLLSFTFMLFQTLSSFPRIQTEMFYSTFILLFSIPWKRALFTGCWAPSYNIL